MLRGGLDGGAPPDLQSRAHLRVRLAREMPYIMPMAIQRKADSGVGPQARAGQAGDEEAEQAARGALEEAAHLGAQVGVAAERAEALPHVPEEREQQAQAERPMSRIASRYALCGWPTGIMVPVYIA